MKLLHPYQVKELKLSSRMVMAPLTRRRSYRNHVPKPIMKEYYAQRASAGLIIAEGCSPSVEGAGYANMPGMYNEEQKRAWEGITREVHQKKGKIFLQVMHTGRVGHVNNIDNQKELLAPSAIPQDGEISTYDLGNQRYSIPKEMSIREINRTINDFTICCQNAIEAGFDGVEIHGAHGYLPNQFINKTSNKRLDSYGGSIVNRLRFILEVIDSCSRAIGPHKVGLRISPFSYADSKEDFSDLYDTYKVLIHELNSFDLAYLHLSHMGEPYSEKFTLWKEIRSIYKGNLILCGDYTKESAEKALTTKEADLVAFGRDFIANPDLVERFKNDWPINQRDREDWYTSGEKGLIDYPYYQEAK